MIDTILFDLDGTLLKCSQEAFIRTYFIEIRKVFLNLKLDGDSAISALWAGTKAMLTNDGTELNSTKFWRVFAENSQLSNEDIANIEAECDRFYANDFNKLKTLIEPTDIPKRIISNLHQKGYNLVLATNPLFPECAVHPRLFWLGLNPEDFIHITHYANSSYCKPHLGYYHEIFNTINKAPGQCMMIGNNPAEDMVVGQLGTDTYLVTDYLENETGLDISPFRSGSLSDLELYLSDLCK